MLSFFILQLFVLLSSSMASNSGGLLPLLNQSCSTSGNYTTGSNFQSNLEQFLSSLPDKAIQNNWFFNDTVGISPDQVYGLAMCYYDRATSSDICRACLIQSASNITKRCRYSIKAALWYPECFIRYSNENFFSIASPSRDSATLKSHPGIGYPDDHENFMKVVVGLMNKLITKIANSAELLAEDGANYVINNTASKIVYGFVQCTRDLSVDNCQNCLTVEAGWIPLPYPTNPYGCNGSTGCNIYTLSCYMRYEGSIGQFYNPILSPPSPSPSPLSSPSSSSSPSLPPPPPRVQDKAKIAVIAVVVVSAMVLLLIIAAILYIRRQRRTIGSVHSSKRHETTLVMTNFNSSQEPSTGQENSTVQEPSTGQENNTMQEPSIGHENNTLHEASIGQENNTLQDHLIMYDFNTLREATNNFSDENKLGEGGFGQVFKATLQNRDELAVKRLGTTSDQGITELKNEVELVGRIKHRNLVKILGYCIQEKEKLLCYEYLPNGSLDKILFATDFTRRKELDWKSRFNIIKGICRGLSYLHVDSGTTIIHRDLKPSNILIDKKMNPKISDFGIARLFDEDQSRKITKDIVGTSGYFAPEYCGCGSFSTKSDVFSFGVIILEIVTGQRWSWNNGLVNHVWRHWSEGKVSELKDPELPDTNLNLEQITICIHIGLLCVNNSPEKRPSISEVYLMLNSPSPSMLPPLPPEGPRG